MMNAAVEKALNEQIHAEFYSFYLYLAMASHFAEEHLDGFAHWMKAQAQEELGHAFKLFGFVTERGGTVKLQAIDAPPATWPSVKAAAEAVLEHEREISGRIDKLVELARSKGDHATGVFLNWFIQEQVEEESSAERLLHQVSMVEASPQGLFMLDRQLAQRGA